MQVNISGHQLDVTDALRDYIAEKLGRLERHFDKITNVQVIMEVDGEPTINGLVSEDWAGRWNHVTKLLERRGCQF